MAKDFVRFGRINVYFMIGSVITLVGICGMISAWASVARVSSASMSRPVKIISSFQVLPVAYSSLKCAVDRHRRGRWDGRGYSSRGYRGTVGIPDADVIDSNITLETAATNGFEHDLNKKSKGYEATWNDMKGHDIVDRAYASNVIFTRNKLNFD